MSAHTDDMLLSVMERQASLDHGIVGALWDIHHLVKAGRASPKDNCEAFDYIIALLDRCLGATTRDTNRAMYQAAQMLGVKYDRFHHILKRVRLHGIRAANDFAGELKLVSPPGAVYMVREIGGDRFKVGFSHDPVARIDYLRRSTGIRLEDVGCIHGYPITETALHVSLRPAWLGGEWYSAAALAKAERLAA